MTTKMKTLLESVLHKSFKFEAKSYEIWQDGCCIRCATCSTCATAEYEDSLFASMKFRLMDNPTYIDNEFSFPLACDDLLEDMVGSVLSIMLAVIRCIQLFVIYFQ